MIVWSSWATTQEFGQSKGGREMAGVLLKEGAERKHGSIQRGNR